MRIIDVDEDLLAPVLYGMRDETMNDYYKNKFTTVKQHLNPTNTMYNDVYRDIEYRQSDMYIDMVKSSFSNLELVGKDEENLYYYKDTREANTATACYIMADRKIRKLYSRGLINGYSSTGYKHNEYQAELKYMAVMDGYMEEGHDGTVEYYNPDIEPLSRTDITIVRKNWASAMALFNTDIDPTEK